MMGVEDDIEAWISTCTVGEAVEGIMRIVAKERGAALAWTDQDEPLPEDEAIRAAFPLKSKRYDLYAEAMRLVGAKRSKGALVDLVNWLLHEREKKPD